MSLFKNKTILITGGTGFLGRALTKEILKQNPHAIRLFSRDEVKHHQTQEIFNSNPCLRHFIGDVRDYARLKKAARGVDYVIHAAALKRIDLLEYNVEEAIKTNILGTLNIVNACLANKVKKAVFVSTDKACSPVNTYGACKFVGERIFSESNYSRGDIETIFTSVRYGNVLESTGSVIPFFTQRIKQEKSIPLTHPDMTRFLITPKQSVELIFKALEYSRGGEVFIPKLRSFKIVDLIKFLIKKYKAKNNLKIVGIRPGEKIHEDLINRPELLRTFEFQNLYIITSSIQSKKGKKPVYITKGKKIGGEFKDGYNSLNNLLTQTQTKKLLKNLI